MSTSIVRSLSLSLSLSTRWYAGDPNPFLGRLLDFRNPIPPHPLSLPRPFQLCVDQRCLIYSPSIPSSLIDFLANPAHTFVGLGIHKDMDGGLHYGLTVANAVDLRVPAAEAYGARELRNAGLAVLARQVLGEDVVKPRRVTMIIPGFLNGPCV